MRKIYLVIYCNLVLTSVTVLDYSVKEHIWSYLLFLHVKSKADSSFVHVCVIGYIFSD